MTQKLLILLLLTQFLQAQPSETPKPEETFEKHFFEALTQKGIENYDKAIEQLQKCQQIQPENPVIYHELGKNYLKLKQYPQAEQNFSKATQINPNERWYWNGLYDVYYQLKDYSKSIPVVQKLVTFNPNFQDDLVSLYIYTQQQDKALELLTQMEQTTHLSKQMELYKIQLTRANNQQNNQKEYLEKQIAKNPKDENAYIQLIYYYSEQNNENKAFEIAQQLQNQIPQSEWAHVSLFKLYIDQNNLPKAIESMNITLGSTTIDVKLKHRIINEFLIYTSKNADQIPQLQKSVELLEKTNNLSMGYEIAKFFITKQQYPQAEPFIEYHLQKNSQDIPALHQYFQVLYQQQKKALIAQKAQQYLDLYPTEASLYYYLGWAKATEQPNEAVEVLENGIDFVIENPALEKQFYQLLADICKKMGNTQKLKLYESKIQ